jgi:hypothetical protein
MVLDMVSGRMIHADEDGCMYDHAAAEALAALAGALESANEDEGAALLLIDLILDVLPRIPQDAPHGSFQTVYMSRGAEAEAAVVAAQAGGRGRRSGE